MAGDIFTNLGWHPVITHWFKDRFSAASPPQEQGWPSIAQGSHTLISAPTGSGKTLAAFLWSIDQLFRRSLETEAREFVENSAGVHTLYISPLKALNNDIHQNLSTPLREIQLLARRDDLEPPPIRVAVRTGDTSAYVRQSTLRRPPHILITTPESFYLLLTSALGRKLFGSLEYIIVDEIHAICNNKRGVHLSLSLERMIPLCRQEPIRIGLSATQNPLARIGAYLGGQQFETLTHKFIPRPVNIIDCGQRRHMDLKVMTPVTAFDELPESSVWQPVYRTLYELIQSHKTTLVFVGMRAQTEKIARELNQLHRRHTGNPAAELALAHHGSISREVRYAIEARLKAGTIPAVIATASLELGIDIGGIDLVVQLEAPKNISGALQRVGRSGHLMSATSKGRIIVLYPADLDDAVAIAHCMHQAQIEETRIPQNALDVLAQQIAAEVAAQSWDYEGMFRLVRQSYCYRSLPQSVFAKVVRMLSGGFGEIPLTALKARLNWDRVNNRLIALRGTRLAAVLNGGTIPDRGYYGVYLQDDNVKLGEVEEEFVFESRVGEVFFLGNSEWRITQITPDRIIVAPVAAINPKAPFWKGNTLYRDSATSKKIGRFRRKLIEKIDRGRAHTWLQQECSVDANTANNLVQYFLRQRKRCGIIATDRQLVAEYSSNRAGEPLLILHAPWGARVNGAWAIALTAALEKHYQSQMQYSFDDDGLLIRLPDTTAPPPFDWLFQLSAEEIEDYLITALPATPVFLVYFRYNAARALILPRSHPGKRIPLWLQRLRASDLLQAVSRLSDFPVLVETYRECLQDVFDLKALTTLIHGLSQKTVRLQVVNTPIPSPMAAGILFKFISIYLYEEDQRRQPRGEIPISRDLLDDILDQASIPAIVTPEVITAAERRWQHLDPQFQAADREDVFRIIEKLGPIDDDGLSQRCRTDASLWLEELQRANRIVALETHTQGFIRRHGQVKKSDVEATGADPQPSVLQRVQRHLQSRGPVTMDALAAVLNLPLPSLTAALNHLYRQNKVVRGRFVTGSTAEFWCDRHNFTQLYRIAITARRSARAPAGRAAFHRFLVEWHRISKPDQPVQAIIQRYRGYRFPLHFFEREILFSRCRNGGVQALKTCLSEFEELISAGDIILHTGRAVDPRKPYIEFGMRGEGNLLTNREELLARVETLSATAKTVYDFLGEHGASYWRDLEWAAGLSYPALHTALQELAQSGLASCENYRSFLLLLQPSSQKRSHPKKKSGMREMIRNRHRLKDGRWFLTAALAVMGQPMGNLERAEGQARMLLQRYGILVKEWYRRETGLLPWYQIFQVLKRMEWRGEIRRGYFISGLSGVQFALPEAVDLLGNINRTPASSVDSALMFSTLDPAWPYGGGMDSGVLDFYGQPLPVVRSATNHIGLVGGDVVVYCENFFRRLAIPQALSDRALELIARILPQYLKLPSRLRFRNRMEVQQINGQPAAKSPLADALIKNGFEKSGDQLVLWPSAVEIYR